MLQQEFLLVVAVIAVGVLHTLVPDHWVPITLMARQSRWSRAQTARAAFGAGLGHTLSTLVIGFIVWLAGLAFALRFGHFVALASSLALVGFGGWIAIASWREIHRGYGLHAHEGHDHHAQEHHHEHDPRERPNSRMALLLILGSSPMVEGLPAFFAAAKFGVGLLAVMAVFFAISTIATYVVLCSYSGATLQRLSLGRFERYGEMLSGVVIALVGVVFLLWPIT